MDLNKPPVVYGVNIEEGGICDKTTCQRALVEGYGFLNTDTLQCTLTVFQVKHASSMHKYFILKCFLVMKGKWNKNKHIRCNFSM